MGIKTEIAWTDHTFNPWIGCTKVSPGCANCYADAQDKFRKWTPEGWGKGKPRRRTSAANWKEPLKWNRASADGVDEGVLLDKDIRGQRVFCASLADWLDDEVPIEWLADILKLIHDTPNLDWQLLTKRPENWMDRLTAACGHWVLQEFPAYADFCSRWLNGHAPANVWIGTSVEDQERADERIPHLLKIPAKVRFLSVEPLLGPVDLRRWITVNIEPIPTAERIQWVIVGGESGRNARACNVEWIRSIVQQCKAAGVSCFVKQLGAKPHDQSDHPATLTLKDPKGGDMTEWPEDLRVREFPC